MILLIVLLSLAALLQQPASRAHAQGVGPGERQEILDKHNALRRGVQPPASNMLKMEWSGAAEANAKRWASGCQYQHSPPEQRTAEPSPLLDGFRCGENLLMSSGPMPWSKVVQEWYDEVKDFQYGVGAVPAGAKVGHYTQVVWYRSYKVGCSVNQCPQNPLKYYYVCQYCPAGNVVGSLQTPYKSGSPCADCPGSCDNGLCTNPCKHDNKYSNCDEAVQAQGCKGSLANECAASCYCPTEIKMILLIVLLSLAALMQQPASRAHALGVGPGEQKQILDKHNALRREVKPTASNMLKMEWSPAARANAERVAKKCRFAHSPPDQRTAGKCFPSQLLDGISCGENIYASSHATSWNDVIQAWYDEVKDFKYGVGEVRRGAVTGHYTQVVWYRSYRIGCYAAHCPQNRFKYLYFCHYCPAGNIQGLLKTPYKSGPSCGDCRHACDNKLCTNPCKHTDTFSNCPDLVKLLGCTKQNMLEDCAASCLCKNEIK
ncbi:uncharacterized protein LOC114593260 [Podarcis muralis]